MIPYFFKLEKDIFTEDLKKFIVDFYFSNSDSFVGYVSTHDGVFDGNVCYKEKLLYEIPEIKKIIDSCVLDCHPTILVHKPYTKIKKHLDESLNRMTVLSTPILPNQKYPSTLFWRKITDETPLAVCNYDDMKPVIFNTRAIHSLETEDSYRINLQICFSDHIIKVKELYQNNKLFSKVKAE